MDFIKETLRWVNTERKYRNIGDPLDELPKGTREDGCACPVACALMADFVGSGHAWFDKYGELVPLPYAVREFVESFDSGDLPQYDLDA